MYRGIDLYLSSRHPPSRPRVADRRLRIKPNPVRKMKAAAHTVRKPRRIPGKLPAPVIGGPDRLGWRPLPVAIVVAIVEFQSVDWGAAERVEDLPVHIRVPEPRHRVLTAMGVGLQARQKQMRAAILALEIRHLALKSLRRHCGVEI